ncbi:MAG: HAMP domain-containing histidine kinase, partial [Bacteroidetes bacterium]|nr:HAMP domain-containing histidine kinase [Bacteroidota bacterium]
LRKFEEQKTTIELSTFELVEFVTTTIAEFKPLIMAKHQNIELGGLKHLEIQSNKVILKSILSNVLSNAIKYSPIGGKISCLIKTNNSQYLIEVHDSGPGFKGSDIEKLYQKFGKLSARPTANETSSGLGLYTVKLLTEKLGGQVKLTSTTNYGSCFTLFFPKQQQIKNIIDY